MYFRFPISLRAPSLLLAAVLQLLPFVRTALPTAQSSPNFLAIIFRWGTAAAALGAVDAISGASTVITTPLNPTVTNGVQLGNNQIRLTTAPDQAGYWLVVGLPGGLYVTNTSSTAYYIRGKPTVTGDFNVQLTAKDKSTSGANRTTTATLVIHILQGSGGNNPPVATAQNVTTVEDTPKAITLTGSDPNSNTLTFAIVTQPAHGTLTGTPPSISYAPAFNYSGSDSFTFKVNDGTVDSPIATVSINVTAINDPPTASTQTVTTAEDAAKAISLAGADVDGNPLTYLVVTPPSHGTLTGTTPSLSYTPASNYNGSDSFTFKVNDGTVDSSAATVSLSVTAVNDPPTANPQSVAIDQNVAKGVTLTGSDVEGSALSFVLVEPPAHGSLSGTPPQVTYTPATDYTGPDAFKFKATDGAADSPAATVSITIAGAVVPPKVSFAQGNVGPSGLTFSATGSPGLTWSIERAPRPAGPWTPIGNLVIGAGGTGEFNDANPPTDSAFYRATAN